MSLAAGPATWSPRVLDEPGGAQAPVGRDPRRRAPRSGRNGERCHRWKLPASPRMPPDICNDRLPHEAGVGHALGRPRGWARPLATSCLGPPPDGVAIVDFYPTHVPESRYLLLADHHGASMESEEVRLSTRKAMRRRQERGEPVFHDGTRGSCAELLLSVLTERDGWSPPVALLDAARMAHASDTAAFPSADAALDFRRSALARADLVALSLSEEEAAASMAAIEAGVDVISAIVALHPETSERILAQAAFACERYLASREIVRENVALFDFTQGDPPPQRVKFAEFADPGAHYAIQLRPGKPVDGQFLVQGLIGRSPWSPAPPPGTRHPDMAELAREFATGGGHPYAAWIPGNWSKPRAGSAPGARYCEPDRSPPDPGVRGSPVR